MARRKMAKPVNAHSKKKLKRTGHAAGCNCEKCKPKTRTLGYARATKAQKKWRPVSSVKGRRRFEAKHGERCYLAKTYTKTGKVLWKFPICSPAGNISCQGLKAAYSRGRMRTSLDRYPDAAKKALRMGKKMKCGWALRHRG